MFSNILCLIIRTHPEVINSENNRKSTRIQLKYVILSIRTHLCVKRTEHKFVGGEENNHYKIMLTACTILNIFAVSDFLSLIPLHILSISTSLSLLDTAGGINK